MKKTQVLMIVWQLSLVIGMGSIVLAQERKAPKLTATATKSGPSPFRYVIVYNDLDNEGTNFRHIELLLDPKAFSKKTLVELFGLLKKRFPQPLVLGVFVYTSLENIETPEERDVRQLSESPNDPQQWKYHHATLVRDGFGSEWFRYTTNLKRRQEKFVILKGKGP